MLTKAEVKKLPYGFTPIHRGRSRYRRKRPIKVIKMVGLVSFISFIRKIAR